MLEKIENPVPYQTIKDIVIWIEEDLTRAMPVIKIAEKSGYSPWYLQRLFKKDNGCFEISTPYIGSFHKALTSAMSRCEPHTVRR
ncbi:hypothetical protein ACU625_16670 [Klebsiella aerogenes]